MKSVHFDRTGFYSIHARKHARKVMTLQLNGGSLMPGKQKLDSSIFADRFVLALAKVVKQCRERLALSQNQLSYSTGLHRSYISDLESGARNVSVKNLSKVAAGLNLKASELVRIAENEIANMECTDRD